MDEAKKILDLISTIYDCTARLDVEIPKLRDALKDRRPDAKDPIEVLKSLFHLSGMVIARLDCFKDEIEYIEEKEGIEGESMLNQPVDISQLIIDEATKNNRAYLKQIKKEGQDDNTKNTKQT